MCMELLGELLERSSPRPPQELPKEKFLSWGQVLQDAFALCRGWSFSKVKNTRTAKATEYFFILGSFLPHFFSKKWEKSVKNNKKYDIIKITALRYMEERWSTYTRYR